jgi:hypothetical protein
VVGVSSKGFEDTALALLTAIEEDLHWEVKGACPKTRGSVSSSCGKCKAHVL